MIPNRVEDWDITVIRDLLVKGYYESELFDFKERLPHAGDQLGKFGLAKSCCAFANSIGGFLLYGIRDDRTLPLADRLAGIEPTADFFEHFGNYPARCVPSVNWDVRKPSIPLDSGKVVHVIYIPRSWNAPHWVEDDRSGKHFAKRTNKGDEEMSYEEVRMSFLQYYEKRLKLQLLRAELETIKSAAKTFIIPELPRTALNYDGGELGLAVVESVLSDTYTILAEKYDLLARLTQVRQLCRMVNAKTERFYTAMGNAPLGAEKTQHAIAGHNNLIRFWAQGIEDACSEAVRLLDEVINS